MILVDSSVWIDYFRGKGTAQTDALDSLLGTKRLAVGDIIVTEVLQGFGSDREFGLAERLLMTLVFVEIGGRDVAIEAARNHRILKSLGFSVRKTIDTLIATRCIEDGYTLLHADRDFEPFIAHLGLRSLL